jgi:hypothetical protein
MSAYWPEWFREDHTQRPLFLDVALQDPIERLTGHLACKHQANLNFAVAPYQRCIDYA